MRKAHNYSQTFLPTPRTRTKMPEHTVDQNGSFLSALANVASQHLIVSLPESPNASHASSVLRAIRKRLNMTQREFGVLLSPGGVSPISPSVICQLESALQIVPSGILTRATAVDAAIEHFGEFLTISGVFSDVGHALKSQGPGCIDQLEPYMQTQPEACEAAIVSEFLSIVTRRKPTSGGSRPGARGPYRKLGKANFSVDATTAVPFAVADAEATGESFRTESGSTQPVTPCSLLSSLSLSSASLASTPRSEISTSSRGSSRPRSPLGSDISTEAATLGVDPSLLNALKRLQEENEALQNENKRLRSMVSTC